MRKLLLLLPAVLGVLLVNACGPTNSCMTSADCADGKSCLGGQCFSTSVNKDPDCEEGATRSCGNPAVGACKPGSQRCVSGKWETACAGEVKPAVESCNGLDDDCDGQVDEDVRTAWFRDVDGDGFGDASAAVRSECEQPAGHVANDDDCDDALSSVSPSASESCATTTRDDDCDGAVNEGCGCTTPGSTVACCGGRGQQTCGGDGMLSACSVMPAGETCNGVDDDCDGLVDEGSTLCGNGQSCNGGTCGCPAGQTMCNGVCSSGGAETCDGVDNDCNGTIDDGAPAPVNGDGGVLEFTGGVAFADGGCAVGVGACERFGATTCTAGGAGCGVTAGAAASESCNGLDDDCDGMVDDGTNLCGVTGQTCNAGSCACPSGQVVCSGACVTTSTEVCDGVDNDCDGEVDETLTIDCVVDADGDRYAENTTVTKQCPVGSRTGFGLCPMGFVAPTASQGVDCDGNDASKWRMVSVKSDGDNDGACLNDAADVCMGSTAPGGKRLTSACPLLADCNDSDATASRFVALRNDRDNDTYCEAGLGQLACSSETVAPTGKKFPEQCAATDDCNDNAPQLYRQMSSRNDADNDGYCRGSATDDCVGAVALPGRRFATSCATTDDCDDGAATRVRLITVRTDEDGDGYCRYQSTVDVCVGSNGVAPAGQRLASTCNAADDCADTNPNLQYGGYGRRDVDNDGWCTGPQTQVCLGSGVQNGWRNANQCAGNDCKDDNAAATSTCTITRGYTTSTHSQSCPNGQQDTVVVAQSFCPLGFSMSSVRAEILSGGGNCSAVNQSTVRQSCNFLEGTTCRVVADCVAQ
ncbi:MAG: MopE-related protein [Archangium sp.]